MKTRWFWHAQNLNEHRDGTTGSAWRHGRAWLHMGDACIGVEWTCWGFSWLGLTFKTGGEDDFQVAVSLGLLTIYVTLSGLLPFRALDRGWPRCTGVMLWFDSMRLGLEVAHRDEGWQEKAGWAWHVYLLDALLGRHQYATVELSTTSTVVPMPEAARYLGCECWKRERQVCDVCQGVSQAGATPT